MKNKFFVLFVLLFISLPTRADMLGVNLYTNSVGGEGYIYQMQLKKDRGIKIGYYSGYNTFIMQNVQFLDFSYKQSFYGRTFGRGPYWEVGLISYLPYAGLGYDVPIGPAYVNVGAYTVMSALYGVNATAGIRF